MNRYFFMEQDNTLMDVIGLRNFDIYGKRHIFTREDAGKINDVTPLYLDESKGECAPDFIKSPVYMVSEKAKRVIDMYEDEPVSKKIVLSIKRKGKSLFIFICSLVKSKRWMMPRNTIQMEWKKDCA